MKILADENIPLLDRFFGDIGCLLTKPGRDIHRQDLDDVDVLLVRSVTQVDEALLSNTGVKFVGTCTIGTDHIDTSYLDQQGIQFCNAPGANAQSVVEYILSCLSILSETHGFEIESGSVGIIGYGNIGSSLYKCLKKLGADCKIYDPLVVEPGIELDSLEEVLACDVVSLHVPFTEDGDYPTCKMIGRDIIEKFGEHQTLINTSRGEVIDEAALKARLQSQPFTVILDVWENEPAIDVELASKVFMGTPHIAGYSLDGKVMGTEMVYQKLCQFLGLPARHSSAQFLDEPPLSKMAFTSSADPDWCMHTAIRACFDVRHDHSQFVQVLRLPDNERRAGFDKLRKEYRCRREFSGVRVQLKQGDSDLHSKFRALGFNLK